MANGWEGGWMVWELFWVRWIEHEWEMKRWKLSCHVNASLFSFTISSVYMCVYSERNISIHIRSNSSACKKRWIKAILRRKSKNINKVDPFRLSPRWAESKVWDFPIAPRVGFFSAWISIEVLRIATDLFEFDIMWKQW